MNSADLGNIVTSFTLYKFLDTLTTPFTQTQAYRLGIIDSNGNLLKQIDKLTNTEKAAYNEFYRLVYSLKRLLIKVPDPEVRARLTNVSSALKLIAEQCESIGGNSQDFYSRALREMNACRLVEEGEGGAPAGTPANSVAGGGIYGLKPEETTFLSKEGQKRHISNNSIFKRRKPNRYYNDQTNSY